MKARTNKNKPNVRARKSRSSSKSAPKASKVKDLRDKDLEQVSGGLTNPSAIKMW